MFEVEIKLKSGDDFRNAIKAMHWCEKNIGPVETKKWGYGDKINSFYFQDEDDAILFRLIWV